MLLYRNQKRREKSRCGLSVPYWMHRRVVHTKHNQVQKTNKQREQKGALPGRKRKTKWERSVISHLTQPVSPNPSLPIPF